VQFSLHLLHAEGRVRSDYAFLPRSEVLSFEEITRLARIFKDHGIEKIRLTGGEPLLRRTSSD